MKVFVTAVFLLMCAGCASTQVQEEALRLQIENNNTQKQILQTLMEIQSQQKR